MCCPNLAGKSPLIESSGNSDPTPTASIGAAAMTVAAWRVHDVDVNGDNCGNGDDFCGPIAKLNDDTRGDMEKVIHRFAGVHKGKDTLAQSEAESVVDWPTCWPRQSKIGSHVAFKYVHDASATRG